MRTCFSKAVKLVLSTESSLGSSGATGSGYLRVFRFLDFAFDNSDTRCSVIAVVLWAAFRRSRSPISAGSAGEAVADGRFMKRLFSFNKLRETASSLFLRALS